MTTSIPASSTATATATVTITGHAAASITDLLEHCDRFFRTAGPAARAELAAYLDQQPATGDAGWLIDMLGFNALYLQAKLTLADDTAGHPGDPQTGGQR